MILRNIHLICTRKPCSTFPLFSLVLSATNMLITGQPNPVFISSGYKQQKTPPPKHTHTLPWLLFKFNLQFNFFMVHLVQSNTQGYNCHFHFLLKCKSVWWIIHFLSITPLCSLYKDRRMWKQVLAMAAWKKRPNG